MYRTVDFIINPSLFPRSIIYQNLSIAPASLVREHNRPEKTFLFSERHLQCAWNDMLWRPQQLVSANGENVHVEYPGRWNFEAGPDFLDAVLVVQPGNRRIQGDIEVHIYPNDWKSHGHDTDPAYSHVVAHVTYYPGPLSPEILPENIIQISLKKPLGSNQEFYMENIDVAAYPYAAPPPQQTPCAKIFASHPPEYWISVLEAAGEERLKTKTKRIALAMLESNAAQVLYEETMCALGYKHNRNAFRQLARVLPLKTLKEESGNSPIPAYALMLGVSGLIPAMTSPRWNPETQTFIRTLWDNWWKQESRWETSRIPPKTWRLSGIRPQNHPVRRLAAAAALFTNTTNLQSQLISLDTNSPKDWLRKTTAIFTQANIDYWSSRLSFSGEKQVKPSLLVGTRRASTIISNVVIPFLAANNIPVSLLLDNLPPEQDNSLIRQTAFSLFGPDHNPALYQQGLRQQGLLQIFHDFCLPNKTACKDCTFAAALQES